MLVGIHRTRLTLHAIIISDRHNRSFYRAANGMFGKVARIASEEVTLHLIMLKCNPVVLYGLDACPLDRFALYFVINRFLMKLF